LEGSVSVFKERDIKSIRREAKTYQMFIEVINGLIYSNEYNPNYKPPGLKEIISPRYGFSEKDITNSTHWESCNFRVTERL